MKKKQQEQKNKNKGKEEEKEIVNTKAQEDDLFGGAGMNSKQEED